MRDQKPIRGKFSATIIMGDGIMDIPAHLEINDCEGYFDEDGVLHITELYDSEVAFKLEKNICQEKV